MSNLKKPPPVEDETHPAYGMIGLSRTMNGRDVQLFGSSLNDHATTMRLTVKRAVKKHDLSRDWYFAREHLIEVEMSSAQFVEMITTPNQGDGVPCTIRHLPGEKIPPMPHIETEVVRVKENFAKDLGEMAQVMRERADDVKKLTAKLPAKQREAIRIALEVMIQQLGSNTPFVLEQFDRATDRVVTAAKQEIEAFTTHAVRAAGLEAIADGRLPKMLSASVDAAGDTGWRQEPCVECGLPERAGAHDPAHGHPYTTL